jgi:hypothetical protein
MISKWLGLLSLLAALVIGDQIRINRPGHKYRLTVVVETPEGLRSGASVMAVHPDRGYSRGGQTRIRGDAVLIDLPGGKNLVALMAHVDNNSLDLDGMNYVALRAYNAAGRKASFNELSRMTGIVPVQGAVMPILVSFSDLNNPGSARVVPPDDLEAALGNGFHLQGIFSEGVPNGWWPLDFGGPLGEPVTRGIEAKLPWLNAADDPSGRALQAAGLATGPAIDAKQAFTRK